MTNSLKNLIKPASIVMQKIPDGLPLIMASLSVSTAQAFIEVLESESASSDQCLWTCGVTNKCP